MSERRRWWQRRKPGKLTTPDGLQAVTLPPGYVEALTLYGLRGSYGYIYRTQPNVRSVIDFLAEEVSALKLKHYEKVPTSPRAPSSRIELEDSDLQNLLNRPSPRVTRTRLWRDTVSDIGVYDVAYWRKVRVGGQVRALLRVPPSSLVPYREAGSQRILYYQTTLGQRVAVDDLVVFSGYDPEQTEGFISPLETLRRVLAEEYASGLNREYTWRNSARKGGVAERPADAPEWSDDQREAWRLETEGIMSGATNSGRILLLEDGMKWNDAAWSPEEMEYLAARKLTRQECAAAFRVDPRLVFAVDDAATAEARTGFYTDRLFPLLTRLSEEVDLQLLPEFEPLESRNQYTQFNLDTKLRGSFLEEAKIASSTVGGPVVSVNEWRARHNLPPVPGGDEIFVPLNSTRGGGPQASPQAPIETPGEQPAGITPGGGTSPPEEAEEAEKAWVPWTPAEPTTHVLTEGDVVKAWLQAEGAWKRREARQEAVRRHLSRQERTIGSLAGALRRRGDVTVEDVWIDGERWDRELARDLEAVGENGNSVELAKTLNQLTRSQLEAAGTDVAAGFRQAWIALQEALR